MNFYHLLLAGIAYLSAVYVALPMGSQDDIQNVPVIRAQGVINSQLKLAVHHLMIKAKRSL